MRSLTSLNRRFSVLTNRKLRLETKHFTWSLSTVSTTSCALSSRYWQRFYYSSPYLCCSSCNLPPSQNASGRATTRSSQSSSSRCSSPPLAPSSRRRRNSKFLQQPPPTLPCWSCFWATHQTSWRLRATNGVNWSVAFALLFVSEVQRSPISLFHS